MPAETKYDMSKVRRSVLKNLCCDWAVHFRRGSLVRRRRSWPHHLGARRREGLLVVLRTRRSVVSRG